jgi:NAD(P)H dehydrogenase (quinone)
MNCMMLLAHPNPESLNHALADAIRQVLEAKGHKVYYHDLYREGFDPLITAKELSESFEPTGLLKGHCDELMAADLIVVVHPNYRNQPPAILKGWVDRVIRVGVAFRFVGEEGLEGEEKGLLKAERALIINTADCPEAVDLEAGLPLKAFWDDWVFSGCGVKTTEYLCFYQVLFSSPEQRAGWIRTCETLAGEIADEIA